MNIDKLCPQCMHEIRGDGSRCPDCGYDIGDHSEEQNNHALKPYTILQGKYLIGNVIGEGGFGITYIGFDLNLEIRIAVKEFYPAGFVTRESNVTAMVTNYTSSDNSQFEKWKESFVREARSLAKFSNLPGIVHVRDFFQENNTAYIVMEYVEGETLKSHLKAMGGKMDAEETLNMMLPVIQSLAKVHDAGIIHRDISPDNIMIENGGSVKLIDFGAARDFGSEGEKSLSVLLKPGFAPEEQYRSKGNQGPWTDVYALCATIYRCITGEKPPESMERMRQDTIRPLSEFGISLGTARDKALFQGMSVFAEKRIQDMRELEAKLYPEGKGSYRSAQSAAGGLAANRKTDIMPKKEQALMKGLPGGKFVYILFGLIAVFLILIIVLVVKINRKPEAVAEENLTAEDEYSTENSGELPADENTSDASEETETDSQPDTYVENNTENSETSREVEETSTETEHVEDEGIHRYAYFIGDITWEEAFENAGKMGGYLVHMNSDQETEYIINELNRNDYRSVCFFIGGKRDSGNEEYYWVDDQGRPFGERLDSEIYKTKHYWLDNEPSYYSDGIEECYMDLIYRQNEDKWYWNDIPNDLVQVSDYWSGKIGYIVEFE